MFDDRDLFAIVARVPVGEGADEAILTQGEEMSVGIVVVDGEVTEGMENGAVAEGLNPGLLEAMAEEDAEKGDRQRMSPMGQILPEGLPVDLAPDFAFAVALVEPGPGVEAEDRQVGEDCAENDRDRLVRLVGEK